MNGYTAINLALAQLGWHSQAIEHRSTFMCKWVFFAYLRSFFKPKG